MKIIKKLLKLSFDNMSIAFELQSIAKTTETNKLKKEQPTQAVVHSVHGQAYTINNAYEILQL